MDLKKCPNCGAQTAPFRSKCEYCGTALAEPVAAKWIAVKDRLPKPSATDPTKSDYVLTTTCSTRIMVTVSPGDEPYNSYDTFVVSAYYDFEKEEWYNYNIEVMYDDHTVMLVTYWMPVPASDPDAWAPLSSLPPADPANPALSIPVLLSADNAPYDSSLFSAQIKLSDGSYEEANSLNYEFTLPVKVWHSLPAPPDVPFS